MKCKRIIYAVLGWAVLASMVGCHSQTEDMSPVTERNAVIINPRYGMTVQDCGSSICYRHPDGGMAIMINHQKEWETNTVLEDVWFAHIDAWNDDLIYCTAEDESYVWYVYDIASDTSVPLAVPDSYPASEALQDVSGICVIGDDLYIMHSYWQGISRFDLTTGAYVTTFDAEVWDHIVLCSADESSFYVPGTVGIAVFDLASGEKTAYDWSEHENWLGSAKICSAYLTEGGRMYLHIAREDAMVPEELKRGILYVNTADLAAEPVRLTTLGDLPACSVKAVCGEYCGTLVLTDDTWLYAYDTEHDEILKLCEMPENDIYCAGAYVMTQSDDGYEVIAEIPSELS